jgi:hypothetical protein
MMIGLCGTNNVESLDVLEDGRIARADEVTRRAA